MRIPSGVTDQFIYFVALDPVTGDRETGLTTFTVYRSRNGAAAAAFTTPTVNETDATNMPGVYELLLDEDMTIAAGNDSEAMSFHITQASMLPVTREIEVYRIKLTAGNTLDVTATGGGGIDWANVENPTTALDLSGTDIQLVDTVTTYTGNTPQTADHTAGIADVPTVAEFNARTLVAASYFDPAADAVATVTTLTNKTGFSLVSTGLDLVLVSSTFVAALIAGVWDRVLTGATHNIATSAGRRLRGIQEFQGYEGGAIWIDTVNGTAGTTDFENGTVENPVDSIADANTLAASLGIAVFKILPGSSLTFAASQTNQAFMGVDHNWTLALGGQSIDGTSIIGATVSGIATNTAGAQFFMDCMMGAVTLPGDTHVLRSGISGTQTLGEAGDYFYDACHSGIAGTSTPVWDFGAALNASNLNVRHYSGGIEIANMGAGTGTYNMSLEGHGQLVIAASCSATSNLSRRGAWKVTDNAGGAVTQTLDDNTQNIADVLVDTGTTIPGTITTLQSDTDDIQTRLPAALVSGKMDSDMTAISGDTTAADRLEAVMDATFIGQVNAGTPTTTAFIVDGTGLVDATDDHYKGRLITFTTGALAGQQTDVTASDGTTKIFTVTALTEAPADNDFFNMT